MLEESTFGRLRERAVGEQEKIRSKCARDIRPVAAVWHPVGSALEMLALSCLFLVGGNPLVIEVNYINILND